MGVGVVNGRKSVQYFNQTSYSMAHKRFKLEKFQNTFACYKNRKRAAYQCILISAWKISVTTRHTKTQNFSFSDSLII